MKFLFWWLIYFSLIPCMLNLSLAVKHLTYWLSNPNMGLYNWGLLDLVSLIFLLMSILFFVKKKLFITWFPSSVGLLHCHEYCFHVTLKGRVISGLFHRLHRFLESSLFLFCSCINVIKNLYEISLLILRLRQNLFLLLRLHDLDDGPLIPLLFDPALHLTTDEQQIAPCLRY